MSKKLNIIASLYESIRPRKKKPVDEMEEEKTPSEKAEKSIQDATGGIDPQDPYRKKKKY